MATVVKSFAISGIDGYVVEIECDTQEGVKKLGILFCGQLVGTRAV